MTNVITSIPSDAPQTGAGLTATLFIGAISLGAALGLTTPGVGAAVAAPVDTTLLIMIFLLFFEFRFRRLVVGLGNLRFLLIAWSANFVVVPLIGFVIASLLVANQQMIFLGLMIYFMAPCTDWFLGFTRLAGGDTALGAALIPINMVSQLVLFPVWLLLLTQHSGGFDMAGVLGLLAQWFLVPLLAAQVLRFVLSRVLPAGIFERLLSLASQLLTPVIAILILQLFAGNVGIIVDNSGSFVALTAAVFLFFVASFFAGEVLSRIAGLDYPQHALLTMTMAARNAPMMIAITAVAIPDQPLILASLVIGMLIEIPHLTGLRHVLLRQFNLQANASQKA